MLNFFVVPVAPGTPTRADDNGKSQLKIEWTGSTGADSLEITFDQDTTPVTDGAATTYEFNDLTPGDSHTVKVKGKAASPCTTEAESSEATLYVPYYLEYETVSISDASVSFKVFVDNTKTFKITTAPTYDSGTQANMIPVASTTEAASFTISSSTSLNPLTKYTFEVGGIQAGTDTTTAGILASQTFDFCTAGVKPENLEVVAEETTTNQIKIKWTKPTTDAPAVKVSFNSQMTTLTSNQIEEFVFQNLKAGESGDCKVIVMGTGANSDCETEETIKCGTKANGLNRETGSITLLILTSVLAAIWN